MIVRIGHGRTAPKRADDYAVFLRQRAIPDYRCVAGNEGAAVLRRVGADGADFLTVSLWSLLNAIRAFHGEDIEAAKYYDEDREFLLEFEPKVVHYEVADADLTGTSAAGS